ncbi:MAG: preprotein translocase subunit SecY [Candidatus Aureabacteria bacterium]|nr:preprotein translocase subunit SecY [Candidatus Auribacterota bacterium]
MLNAFGNIFKVPELKERVLFTLGIICVVRLGAYIPTPGVDGFILSKIISEQAARMGGGNLIAFMDMFSGGAMQHCTLFALGIMPYISASIIMQLLTAVIPSLEKLAREGEVGHKKIREYTRYGTFFLSMFQSFFIARFLSNPANFGNMVVVPRPGVLFIICTVMTLTCGTTLLMWLGEQITEKGVGNGASLIITINILSRLPTSFATAWKVIGPGEAGGWGPAKFAIVGIIFVSAIVFVVMITQGERKIPVQYAKRVIGRKQFAGQSSFIPLRVNYAGVIPIIFASSLLLFPATIGSFWPQSPFFSSIARYLSPPHFIHYFLYVLLIVFFCFFWNATVFNPIQMAEHLRQNSAFIPGIRPGKTTSDFLDKTMTRITFPGALFLAGIAIIPDLLAWSKFLGLPMNVAGFFGGTSLLIIVGVMLDTMRQIEAHLISRHYEGFMKKGKLKGRRAYY